MMSWRGHHANNLSAAETHASNLSAAAQFGARKQLGLSLTMCQRRKGREGYWSSEIFRWFPNGTVGRNGSAGPDEV